MNGKFESAKSSAGDTGEHEGVTYRVVRQEQDEMCRGVRSIREANPAKAPEGGCA